MKKRAISAIVMIIIFIPILLLGDIYYPILGGILGILALLELLMLLNVPNIMKLLSIFIGLFLILYKYNELSFNNIYSFSIIAIIFLIYSFSIIINRDIKKYTYSDALLLFSMVFMIGLFFNSFIKIRLLGVESVIYCFIISVFTDTFAYLGGSFFGKHKLIPCISPNKTIEGSICGSLFGMIIGSVFYYFVLGGNILEIIILSLVLTIFAQFGDLFFSSIKRYYKIKDFSNMIPGHGGILDRLDSVLFVILGFLVYINII